MCYVSQQGFPFIFSFPFIFEAFHSFSLQQVLGNKVSVAAGAAGSLRCSAWLFIAFFSRQRRH
jgi:hypothetical protein